MSKQTPDDIACLNTCKEPMNHCHRKLLSTEALAEYLDVAVSTLRQYRLDGKGPTYIKIGHLVRYRVEDVEEWLATKKH